MTPLMPKSLGKITDTKITRLKSLTQILCQQNHFVIIAPEDDAFPTTPSPFASMMLPVYRPNAARSYCLYTYWSIWLVTSPHVAKIITCYCHKLLSQPFF